MTNQPSPGDLASDPKFEWLAESKRYLLAADTLRTSDKCRRARALLRTPTLHLLAHGIELFLKANLICEEATPKQARAFGHDIWSLWNDGRNASARRDLLAAADEFWLAAKSDPMWGDDFRSFTVVPFEVDLKRLSALHTDETDFALRYVRPAGTEGPQPHLLCETFYRIANRRLNEMTSPNS